MNPYPKYKDSGIEWLGEVPERWEIIKTQYLLDVISGNGFPENLQGITNGEYPFFKVSDINIDSTFITEANNSVSKEMVFKNSWKIIPSNSILLPKIGEALKKNHRIINKKDCLIDNNMMALYPKKLRNINRHFLYFLLCYIDMEWFVNPGAVPSVDVKKFKLSYLPIPSETEQNKISTFLVQKTSKIDELIKKNERLIELLREKRQAIISHAVTKGLDPNAKMKDSGIEWIGEVPEGWEVKKIKHTSYVKGRIGWHGLRSDEFTDEGPYLITGTDFIDGRINWEACYHISEERYNQDPYIHLKEKDLLITKDGTIGKVALVKNLQDKASLNSGIMLIRPLKNYYLTDFMFWVLNSEVFNEYIEYTKTGSTVQHLYQETFDNFIFPLPSTNEQENICSYLTEKTLGVDNLIQKIQSQIATLKEYHQALISNVVTGKVRVDK